MATTVMMLRRLGVPHSHQRLSLSRIFWTRRISNRHMSNFRIVQHVVRTQHTRDRRAATERGRENDLKLHVKQYVPIANVEPRPDDVTIIGAQANAFPKEMYEPFWDDVYEGLHALGKNIRGIWIADMATQGQSGIINEQILGPDSSWWDHGRDLLFLINQFQDEMPHPIIGIGHSVGASHLTHLSFLHPRLLDSMILVDPIMQRDLGPHKTFARLSTSRRDIWPSREAAAKKFKSSKFYQGWDPRVLDKWIEYGLRDLPTEQYPEKPQDSDPGKPPVTLSTTVAQEVYLYLRAYYPESRLLQDENLMQDIHPSDRTAFPFGRPETQELHRRLPEVRPSVLYIFGNKSEASPPEYRRDKMKRTGTGVGGSGGAANGKVKEVVLDCGHLVGMEDPVGCAKACASFMVDELEAWALHEREWEERVKTLSRKERIGINELWRTNIAANEQTKVPGKDSKL